MQGLEKSTTTSFTTLGWLPHYYMENCLVQDVAMHTTEHSVYIPYSAKGYENVVKHELQNVNSNIQAEKYTGDV